MTAMSRISKVWKKNEKVPYQTVSFRGKTYSGRFDTPKVFAALDIKRDLIGKSFIDLGCNRGGLVFLAEEHGAKPTVGVDVAGINIDEAIRIGEGGDSKSLFYCSSIQEFVPTMEKYDFVVCMAVFRHLYADIVRQTDPNWEKKKGFLTADSLDVLIRQNVGDPSDVITCYNELIARMLAAARERFICSYNDESGLILRRQNEVVDYFKAQTDRVEKIEIYLADLRNPKFVVVDVQLKR